MIRSVSNGYATSSTDTGHQGIPMDARSGARPPREGSRLRSSRDSLKPPLTAKALINALLSDSALLLVLQCLLERQPAEGLMEAQRYTDDYDGIIAGALVLSITRALLADFRAGISTPRFARTGGKCSRAHRFPRLRPQW